MTDPLTTLALVLGGIYFASVVAVAFQLWWTERQDRAWAAATERQTP